MLDRILADDPRTSAHVISHLVARLPVADEDGRIAARTDLVASLAAHPNRDVTMALPIHGGPELIDVLGRPYVDAARRTLLLREAGPRALAAHVRQSIDPDPLVWARLVEGIGAPRLSRPALVEVLAHPRSPRDVVAQILSTLNPRIAGPARGLIRTALARHDLLDELAHLPVAADSGLASLSRGTSSSLWDVCLDVEVAAATGSNRWADLIDSARCERVSAAALTARATIPVWLPDPSGTVAASVTSGTALRMAALTNMLTSRPQHPAPWRIGMRDIVQAGDPLEQLSAAAEIATVAELLRSHTTLGGDVLEHAWAQTMVLHRAHRSGGIGPWDVAVHLAGHPACPLELRRALRRWVGRYRNNHNAARQTLTALTDPRTTPMAAVGTLPWALLVARDYDVRDLVRDWLWEQATRTGNGDRVLLTALTLESEWGSPFATLDELWTTAAAITT